MTLKPAIQLHKLSTVRERHKDNYRNLKSSDCDSDNKKQRETYG